MKHKTALSPAALSFLDGLRQNGASDGTLAAYRAGLQVFESLKIPIDENVITTFRTRLAKRYAPATLNLYLSALRKYLTHLIAEGYELNLQKAEAKAKNKRINRREGYKRKKAPDAAPDVVTLFNSPPAIDENAKWARELYLEWLRNRAMLHTIYASAGRISEVLSLTRKDVAGGHATEVLITGKGDKQRTMFLTPDAQAAIRAYCDARDDAHPALFISHRKGKGNKLSRRQAWKIVHDAGAQIGIKISPHLFRHYRATQLINEGMPLESVQAYLGHASPETTRIVYADSKTRVIREQLAEYGLSPSEAATKKAG